MANQAFEYPGRPPYYSRPDSQRLLNKEAAILSEMTLMNWALPQLSRLLPLDEDSLQQIITYADTLSKDAAAEHLKNLLGDSPQALEFISSFNTRRRAPSEPTNPASSYSQDASSRPEVPKGKPRRKKPPLNQLRPPREVEDQGNTSGAYIKREEQDYMTGRARPHKEPPLANALALHDKPDALQLPRAASTTSSREASPKPPPPAAGRLISDLNSPSRSRASSSGPKTKVNLSGGTPMHGQSSTINDLDSAIRTLEIQTNPNLASAPADNSKRRCNCMATRHPLLAAAPNCLNCGKIICVKEGLGPCTFCSHPLLSSSDIQSMVRVLREERGREKMEANNASHKRAEVSQHQRPFASRSTPASSAPTSDSESEKLTAAQQHRDKLLNYQAQNARRTRIHDEAADFETPVVGQSLWASPQERALQLKRQQKVLREQEWSARPEYEKRKVVVSVDLVGGKVVKRMANVERPDSPVSDDEDEVEQVLQEQSGGGGSGAFSRNPLLGSLIRPVAKKGEDDDGGGKGNVRAERERNNWRRVQDDDDNEQYILDGGVYGGRTEGRTLGQEEHACG